jgi:hypothetical protein
MEDFRFQDSEAPMPFLAFGRKTAQNTLRLLKRRLGFAPFQFQLRALIGSFRICASPASPKDKGEA